MNSVYQLKQRVEKDKILELLSNKRREQWNSKKLENFWHTARMHQSLSKEIIEKNIYVNNMDNIKFILVSFMKIKNRVSVNFEIWLQDNLKEEELVEISKVMMRICHEVTQEGKFCFFRSLPLTLFESIKQQNTKYNIKIGFSQVVKGLHFNYEDEKCILPSKEGFIIKNMSEENVIQLIKYWKYGHLSDREWMTRSIIEVFGLGLWDSKTGKLIGHFIYMLTGTFGGLSIDDNYRGKGLGRWLVKAMIEKCRNKEMHMLIEIEDDNTISQTLFTSMNFNVLTECLYVAFQSDDQVIEPKEDL